MVSPGRRIITKQITSRANPIYKAVKTVKVGFAGNMILVEGEKLITEALAAGLTPLSAWSDGSWPLLFECPTYQVSASMYASISPTRSGRAPLAVFPAPPIREARAEDLASGRFLLLDRVQEPGNAGALVRAAAAFSMTGVVWLSPCAYPYHHGTIRASAGSCFHLPQWVIKSLPDDLETPIIGAAGGGAHDMESFSWPKDLLLAMGNEGHGLSEEMEKRLSARVRIAIAQDVESLNVAGAAHILMYHLQRG